MRTQCTRRYKHDVVEMVYGRKVGQMFGYANIYEASSGMTMLERKSEMIGSNVRRSGVSEGLSFIE